MLLNGVYDVRVEVPRKRGRELYARYPCRRHRPQKPRERCRALDPFEPRLVPGAVAVDVLPYQLNFLVTLLKEPSNLFDYLGGSAATFAPARIRHDAVCAELITPLYDWDECYVLRTPLGGGGVPRFALASPFEVYRPALAFVNSPKELRNSVHGPRARDYIYRRRVFKDRFPFKLGHTAHQPYNRRTAGALTTYVVDPVENLSLGLFAYRASVEENE